MTLLESSVLLAAKGALLFLGGTSMLLLMRRASAASRHLAIALLFAASLALPILANSLPGWTVLPASGWSDPLPRPGTSGLNSAAPEAAGVGPSGARGPATPPPPQGHRAADGSGDRALFAPWAAWLPVVWASGTAALLFLLVGRIAAMEHAVRRAEPFRDPTWQRVLARSCRGLGLRTPVLLRRGPPGQMPLVWGVRHPVILLPAGSELWTPERMRTILAHEAAHIARRDIAVLLLAHVACALHWFNPLSWWLRRRLVLERERACDDLVVNQGFRATSYAQQLLQVATEFGNTSGLAPVVAARTDLEVRVMALLDNTCSRRSTSGVARITLAMTLLMALIPFASMTWSTPDIETDPTGIDSAASHSAWFSDHLNAIGLDRKDVDGLIQGLSDDDAATRGASAWALGQIEDERAVLHLVGAINDESSVVREWVVRALGRIGDRSAVEPLIGRLDDPSGEVREWAVRSLGSFQDDRATEPLIARLDDEDSDVREWAVRALGNVDDGDSVPDLIERLSDENADVREWAVRALSAFGDRRAMEPLSRMVEDESADVRHWARRALAHLNTPGGSTVSEFGP